MRSFAGLREGVILRKGVILRAAKDLADLTTRHV
jgi:hypothetical protein